MEEINQETLFDDIEAELVEQGRSEEDINEIREAFLYAKKLHQGQYRVSYGMMNWISRLKLFMLKEKQYVKRQEDLLHDKRQGVNLHTLYRISLTIR